MAFVEYSVARKRSDQVPSIKLAIGSHDPSVRISDDAIRQRLEYDFVRHDEGWYANIIFGSNHGNYVEMTVSLDSRLARCGTIYKYGPTRTIGLDPVQERHDIVNVRAEERLRGKFFGYTAVSSIFRGKDLTGAVEIRPPVEVAFLNAAKNWNINYSSMLQGRFVCFEHPALIRIRIILDHKLSYMNYTAQLPAYKMKIINEGGRSATVTIPSVEDR